MKAIVRVIFLAAGCLAAKLPNSYVNVPPAAVRVEQSYVPPAPQPVATAPVRVEQSYVPPASEPVATAPVRVEQSYVPPASQPVATAPVRVEQSYVPPAPVSTAPVKQLKETYVPPKKSSSKIVFPPSGERAPWHPDPRPQPEQPLVVSGGPSRPGAAYVPPAREAPSAQPPQQTYVPPAQPAQPPQQTYVPPAQPAQPPQQSYVPPY